MAFLRCIPDVHHSTIAPPESHDLYCPSDRSLKPSEPQLWHILPWLTATPSFQVLSSPEVRRPSHNDHAVWPYWCPPFPTHGAQHARLWLSQGSREPSLYLLVGPECVAFLESEESEACKVPVVSEVWMEVTSRPVNHPVSTEGSHPTPTLQSSELEVGE